MKWTCFLLLWTLSVYSSKAQEYSYTHYDIAEGLAGSTVYCITQDKEGFIWAGTETGVSRFDGTHFRTFTVKDGLPDVEILQMFCDSRGRVWMAPFRRTVCFFYKGKIYNQDNDPVLRAIHLKGNIEGFAEAGDGTILIQESTRLHLLNNNGVITDLDSIHHRPLMDCHAVSRDRLGDFLVQAGDSVYSLRKGRFTTLFGIRMRRDERLPVYVAMSSDILVWRSWIDQGTVRSLVTGRMKHIPFSYYHYRHVSYTIVSDSIVCSNEATGTTEYALSSDTVHSFLKGIEVSRTFVDDEGNTWFSTIGRGIYRLNSKEMRNFSLKQSIYDVCAVWAIRKVGDELLLGSNRNSVFHIRLSDMQLLGEQKLTTEEKKRILFVDTISHGRTIYGGDYNILIRGKRPADADGFACNVKAAFLRPDGKLLVAAGTGVFLMDLRHPVLIDTLWRERATSIFYKDDSVWFGTLNGLYLLTGDHHVQWLGKNIPFLRRRISAITASPNGIHWVSSYDDGGIIGVRNGKVVRTIGPREGLTNDICRTMALEGDVLWVGTDKGLYRIDPEDRKPVTRYTANDGLGSNVINTIFVDSPMVYVGTPAGLTYFNETRINQQVGSRLSWLDVTSSGHSLLADSANLKLSYRDNNIRFEYAGISYTSAGQILYQYRLLGLDTSWRSTRETFLDYPTLPSGRYELQIVAINKFNVRSLPITMRFEISTPFWRAAWFLTVVGLGIVTLTWLAVSTRIRRIRRRQKEKEALVRKMNELEHMALQAQMNPHFIFNCLNSIQQYIFDKDILAANRYLTGFSRLIRSTLHNSSQAFIPLSDEIRYLATYLSLEKLRFKDKMEYTVEVADNIEKDMVMVPPMLVQPYVENGMRHGLRHKTDGKGYIRIQMSLSGDHLLIVVEDNGIGRQQAARYKTAEHIEYQSKGMSLTAERIGLINAIYGERIAVEIQDLTDAEGRAAGTRVVMRFPANYDNNKLTNQ